MLKRFAFLSGFCFGVAHFSAYAMEQEPLKTDFMKSGEEMKQENIWAEICEKYSQLISPTLLKEPFDDCIGDKICKINKSNPFNEASLSSSEEIKAIVTCFCEQIDLVFDIDQLIDDLCRLTRSSPTSDVFGWSKVSYGGWLYNKWLAKLQLNEKEKIALNAIFSIGKPSLGYYKKLFKTYSIKHLQTIKMWLVGAVNRICEKHFDQEEIEFDSDEKSDNEDNDIEKKIEDEN